VADEGYQNPDNSQTAPILDAAVNSDPTPLEDDSDVVVSDESLVNETGPDGSAADISNASSTQISVYQVQSGDTLSSIAQMFGVTVNTIRGANDIQESESIQPGESLIILPIPGTEYTVKSGDTIESIASSTGADVEDIMNYNDLKGDADLEVGSALVIPDAEETSVSPASQTAPASSTKTSGKTTATSASGTTKKPTTATTKTTAATKTSGVVGKVSTLSKSDPLYNPAHNDSGLPDYAGYYALPIAHGVLTQGLHGYNAVDLATKEGTAIRAAADGKVIIAKSSGYNGGYGNYVVIQHGNGTQTLYGHMKTVGVEVGEEVTQYQQIGTVGMTGLATGPHVHFEVRGAVNPFSELTSF